VRDVLCDYLGREDRVDMNLFECSDREGLADPLLNILGFNLNLDLLVDSEHL
jgi:hypothetical protein